MIGEDFGMYSGLDHAIPSYIVWMGTQTKNKIDSYTQQKKDFPTLHSSYYYPEFEEALPASIKIVTACLFDLFK